MATIVFTTMNSTYHISVNGCLLWTSNTSAPDLHVGVKWQMCSDLVNGKEARFAQWMVLSDGTEAHTKNTWVTSPVTQVSVIASSAVAKSLTETVTA